MRVTTPPSFTPTEAITLISEAENYLAAARRSVERGDYVGAEAWASYALEVLRDQDIIGDLAAQHRIRIADA